MNTDDSQKMNASHLPPLLSSSTATLYDVAPKTANVLSFSLKAAKVILPIAFVANFASAALGRSHVEICLQPEYGGGCLSGLAEGVSNTVREILPK